MTKERITDLRRSIHQRYTGVIFARPGDVLFPALHLAKSLRSLSGEKLLVLDALLRVFAEHPRPINTDRVLRELRAKLEGDLK